MKKKPNGSLAEEEKHVHASKARTERKRKASERERLKKMPTTREKRVNLIGNYDLFSGLYIVKSPERIPEIGDPTVQWLRPWPRLDEEHRTDLRDDAKRLFPTTKFPAEAFSPSDDGRGVELWTQLFHDCWEFAAKLQPNNQTSRDRCDGVLPTNETARRIQVWYDAEDGLELVDYIWDVLRRIPSVAHDALRVASAAYYMGRLAERHEVRSFEGEVVEAAKSRRRGLKAASVTNSAHAENWPAYKAMVKGLLKEGVKYTPATVRTADYFGCSAKTVQNHTKDLRPKKGKEGTKIGNR